MNQSEMRLQELFELEQYSLDDKKKNEILLAIIKKQLYHTMKNPYIKHFFERQNVEISSIECLEDVPALPVQMFKYFDLATCSKEEIVRVLRSSGTTNDIPSKVPLNKNTIINQTKALKSILSNYLGNKRKIFLVIDHEGVNDPAKEISARTAAVRGLSMYAKKIFYLMKKDNGKLVPNIPVIMEIAQNYKDDEAYVFGFTFIIWSAFLEQIKGKDIKFSFKDVKIFHSGGWKKLEEKKISKSEFSRMIADIFSTKPENVYDFYGMAEQTGVIFVDCEYGNKHVPNFSQIIIRNPQTLKPCSLNDNGIIEVMSVLSDSYYSQAILTEDKGYLAGIDDCMCGRKGRYFRFSSRLQKVELKGCGDTFREKND